MHILLTDILICPRCGPAFGLIALSDEIRERQIVRGDLGCPNCRHRYPINQGVADLRVSHGAKTHGGTSDRYDPDRAYRLAALLGVTQANANLLIVERSGALAASIAEILPQAHIVGASTDAPPQEGSDGFLSRILFDRTFPFRGESIRGVAFAGGISAELAQEAHRILMPGTRLVVDPAGPEVADLLRSIGYVVQLEQERVVVAAVQSLG